MPQKQNKKQSNITVGVKDESGYRNQWPLARVVDTADISDGMTSKVKPLLAEPDLDKRGKRKAPLRFLERPIHKLVVLLRDSEI